MARIARVVVPGLPHHVTQRGNPREPVFLGPRIIGLPPPDRGGGASAGTEKYCLMPNHLHLIAPIRVISK